MSQTKFNLKSGPGYNSQGATVKKRITPKGSLEQEICGNVIVLPGDTKAPKQIEGPNLKDSLLNYCVSGLMSRCTVEQPKWEYQQKCKFAEKSTVANRCMSYIEAIGGHCDCQKAQHECKK